MPEKFDEMRVIQDILEGRVEAFESLVCKYQRYIYFMIMRMVRKVEEADELTQQTFLKAYKNLKQYRGEASFKTWITQIALNLTRTEFKRNKKVFVEFDEKRVKIPAQISTEEEQEEKKVWLGKMLDSLPPTQKEVVNLRIYEEKSFQQIASLLNSKEGTVKVNFHHAMKQLKEWCLKKKDFV